jgi:hypothetical protein
MPFQSEKQRRFLHANKPKMAEEWENKEAANPDDIFDRAPKPPEDVHRRRPKNPYWDLEKSWWEIIKQVDIDFTYIKPGEDSETEQGLPRTQWTGLYDRLSNKIWINLSSWKGQDLETGEQLPYRSKEGQEYPSDFTISEEIMETIMHESGHAAALSKDAADLEDEIEMWALQRLASHAPKDVNLNQARPVLGRILDYLVHEYIAAICEKRMQPGPRAMRNAWDQTAAALKNDFGALIAMFGDEGEEYPDMSIAMMDMMGMNVQWEFAEHVLPILNKHFKNMSDHIFTAYKEGTSSREKKDFEELTGEKAKPIVRGSFMERGMGGKEEEADEGSWMERLRDE